MAPSPLGVGILYNPALPPFLAAHLDAIDFVSVIPDMFWRDHGAGAATRFQELPSWLDVMDGLATRVPVVAHDIGLSLGSAERWDEEYLEQLVRWQARYGFRWHGDHLSYVQVGAPSGMTHNAGMALPVPYDHEVLELVAGRTRAVGDALGVPFLVENGVAYAEIPEQDMDEATFLGALCRRGGCGLLLDLHNLHVDACNRGLDSHAVLARIDLAPVVEVHIAGGSELAGFYTDSHAGPCPEIVFELLDTVVQQAPNLAAITFEFHDSYYPRLKLPGILAQVERARAVWSRRTKEERRVVG